MFKHLFLSIFLIVSNVFFSQLNQFSVLGKSSREMSLGKSMGSNTLNVSDLWINPAGMLSLNGKTNIAYQHGEFYRSTVRSDIFSLSKSIDSLDVAWFLGAYQIAQYGAFNTLEIQQQLGTFDFEQIDLSINRNYGLRFGLAKRFSSKINSSMAINYQFLRTLDFSNLQSLGVDFSVDYHIDSSSRFSIVVQDILGRYLIASQSSALLSNVFSNTENYLQFRNGNVIAPSLKMYFSKKIHVNDKLTTDVMLCSSLLNDAQMPSISNTNYAVNLGVGNEWILKEKYYLRLGLTDFRNKSQQIGSQKVVLSTGFGIKIGKLILDYGLAGLANSSQFSQKHIMGLEYHFE